MSLKKRWFLDHCTCIFRNTFAIWIHEGESVRCNPFILEKRATEHVTYQQHTAFLLSCFSHVQLFATLWREVHQAPLSMGFSRQEYWNVLPCSPLGDLPNPGIKTGSLKSPALAGMFFTTRATWEAPSITLLVLFSSQNLSFCIILFIPILEKAMAPHSSTLAWKIPWMEEPGGLQSMGSLRVGHNWATSLSLFTSMHWRGKWQPTPVFLPGESQGRGSLVGCCLWGRTESDTTEVT